MKVEQVYTVPKVYVESSVISAYFDERVDVVSVSQRHWSRVWWDQVRTEYDVVINDAVTNELSHPSFPHAPYTLALVADMPRVRFANEIRDIVNAYITRNLMPQNPIGDALHLALASYHKCDYLLTWNCKHLANPNKFQHLRIVNTLLGLHIPILATPNQLIGEFND